MRRTETLYRVARAAFAALVVALLVARVAAAQQGVLLQGIVDGEAWSTNSTSSLLTRNGGKPASLARLQLWGAYEPVASLVFYAQGSTENGSAARDGSAEVYTNQFGVRWIASRAFVLDAGRISPIIGMFSARHFSTRNPLIGEPDGYATDYPLGVKVAGETDHFDYRAGLLTLPTSHAGYEPTPTPRLRPAIGAGFTPIVGFRIGGSFTVGPYLNRQTFSTGQYADSWTEYHQRIAAADLEFARGYLETHFELARGSYDVPGRNGPIAGVTWYGEGKYTFTPRFFAAARVERNDYPFIRATTSGGWTARLVDLGDAEAGVGYRLTASTLLKASYRVDRWWWHTPAARPPDGRALALQVSQSFDVMDMLDRVRVRDR